MTQIVSSVTKKGQVTIPAEVRRHLGLQTTGKVAFVIDSQGTVQLKAPRYSTIASLRGAAGSLGRPSPWEAMRAIAREDALGPALLRADERSLRRHRRHHPPADRR